MMAMHRILAGDVVGRWCGGDPMLAKKRAMSPVSQTRKSGMQRDRSDLRPEADM